MNMHLSNQSTSHLYSLPVSLQKSSTQGNGFQGNDLNQQTKINFQKSYAGIAQPPIHFGFLNLIGNVISQTVEKIDSSKAVELVTTDVAGMVLPRTYIEYNQRGFDAGRETIIRELAGTVFNVFLVGWLGSVGLKMFNNRSAKLNPMGLHTGAWVNAKTLKAFGALFEQCVTAPGASPQSAREAFIKKVLASLESADGFVLDASVDVLKQMDSRLGEHLQKNLDASVGKAGAKTARLYPQAQEELAELLRPASISGMGTHAIEPYMAQYRESLVTNPNIRKLALTKEGAVDEELFNKLVNKLVAQERLARSGGHLGSQAEKLYLDTLKDKALAGGLSNEVNLMQGTETLLSKRSLASTLGELKHFLEQFGDRVLYSHQNLYDSKTGELSSKTFEELGVSTQGLMTKLLGPAQESGILAKIGKYLPTFSGEVEKVGLIPYAMKSRWLLTALPIVLTIAVSVSISFINNWITRRRHGGKVFFPGEGGPTAQANSHSNLQTGRSFDPSQRLSRPGSAFEAFQRQRSAAHGGF
ncbi:MAG: hypothetical protein K2X66_13245 [Cyanobacteria bacterium]|nr:hypothetical protein [Cyanobacteriota bacterium]